MTYKFTDIGDYARFFTNGPVNALIFASHGIWSPKHHGMTRVGYSYNWYSKPSEPLMGEAYKRALPTMGVAEPVDRLGPGSGQVQNVLMLPLEQSLFAFTIRTIAEKIRSANPLGLAMFAFHGSSTVKALDLKLIDTQLLPALRMPKEKPLHMVVCRSSTLKHVNPVVSGEIKVFGDVIDGNEEVFNSITEDML